MSKSTLTFSCLLSSWCLCMKYWSLSCCLRSWCFSCRCRSSSSQNAASRAGRKRKVGSGIAIPSQTSQSPGVYSEVVYKCILETILFHSKCFYYSSRLVMKVFDFMKWRKTIDLLKHQCLFPRENLVLDTSHELLFVVEAISFNSGQFCLLLLNYFLQRCIQFLLLFLHKLLLLVKTNRSKLNWVLLTTLCVNETPSSLSISYTWKQIHLWKFELVCLGFQIIHLFYFLCTEKAKAYSCLNNTFRNTKGNNLASYLQLIPSLVSPQNKLQVQS